MIRLAALLVGAWVASKIWDRAHWDEPWLTTGNRLRRWERAARRELDKW